MCSSATFSTWRAAVSLAFVDLEWPHGEPRDLWTAYLVQHALMTGHVRVALAVTGLQHIRRHPVPRAPLVRRVKCAERWQNGLGVRAFCQERVKATRIGRISSACLALRRGRAPRSISAWKLALLCHLRGHQLLAQWNRTGYGHRDTREAGQ